MVAEVEHWRDRAARAEQWLRTIQQQIEEELLTRRSFSGAEGVAARYLNGRALGNYLPATSRNLGDRAGRHGSEKSWRGGGNIAGDK